MIFDLFKISNLPSPKEPSKRQGGFHPPVHFLLCKCFFFVICMDLTWQKLVGKITINQATTIY